MTIHQAELIDIDFLHFLIDESYDDQQDGDLITFVHPRRGRLTALQSGRTALLIEGGFKDRRGLPATACVLALDEAFEGAPRPLQESSGVVIQFPADRGNPT